MLGVTWRQPFDPNRATAEAVQQALRNYGGTNEFGEPLWRTIQAEDHLVQRGGEWRTTRPEDDMVQFAPGPRASLHYQTQEVRAVKVEHGTRWIRLYPCKGWILERWFPASCFGSKPAWEAVLSADGKPMMGPYPSRGDYWLMAGPWENCPALSDLHRGVSSWENSTAHLHGRVDKLDKEIFDRSMAKFLRLLEEEDEAQYLRVLGQAQQFRREVMKDLMTNPRLTGFRNRKMAEFGQRSHI